ncbi:MAG: anthranilate phosphoribosyltransferase [Chitinophagales bacterium]
MKEILHKLFDGDLLTEKEANNTLKEITSGNVNDVQVAAFLSVFNTRYPTTEEMIGFRKAMLEQAVPVNFHKQQTIDIVGTGGDGKDTFNISTLASLVCAGAGVKVTKHGNYSASSISGASNVLEYLGVKFTANEKKLNQQLDEANITFLHAPLFHPAMKNVAHVRKQLQVKTIFNWLGPLVNPCQPTHHVIGVCEKDVASLFTTVLNHANTDFRIIYTEDGYDEISLTATAFSAKNGSKTHTHLTFEKLGFAKVQSKDIYGGTTIESNAKIFMDVLNGKGTTAQNNVVLANAALAISLFENFSYYTSVEVAKESLLNGKALQSFNILKSI